MLRELMPHLSEVATGPQSEAFARLTRAMSGGNEAEEQLISRLERLRADDVRRPPRGLPPDTPFRMQVIARRDFTAGTGIPSGLVWDVCMAPYLASQMSDPARFAASLAAAVAGPADGPWSERPVSCRSSTCTAQTTRPFSEYSMSRWPSCTRKASRPGTSAEPNLTDGWTLTGQVHGIRADASRVMRPSRR